MNKAVLSTCVLLLSGAPAAHASGFDITYGPGCWLENPSSAQTFACDTNEGSMTFTVSCILTQPVPDFVGFSAAVDGETWVGVNLPAWWQLSNAGACRATSLTVSADFTTAPRAACADLFGGLANGGIEAYETIRYPPPPPLNVPPPNHLRLKVAYGLPSQVEAAAGAWFYLFRATIDHAKTVGTGACGGCLAPLTLHLEEVVAHGTVSGEVVMTKAMNNWCLTWRGGAESCWYVPARNSTWGQVKGLYR